MSCGFRASEVPKTKVPFQKLLQSRVSVKDMEVLRAPRNRVRGAPAVRRDYQKAKRPLGFLGILPILLTCGFGVYIYIE